MASSENQQQFSHPAPPSLSAGDHETRDYYAAQDASRPASLNEPYLTPYLGLRARLSQTWINRWTILLLLVLIRTVFAIASVDNGLGVARKQALSACTSVENIGSAMASMPHYMSQGVNELTADGIEKAISGLMEMLILTVTGVEEIVVFIIGLLTNTYLCLVTFAVTGSLHVAIDVAEDVGNFLNSTAQGVGKDLGSAASAFQNAMNSFMSDIDKLGNSLTGNDANPPTIDLSSEISKLNGIQLPGDYDHDLENLNASIPTFAQVKNLTESIIRLPFEEVKTLLNQSLPKYDINGTLFPVPAKEQLTFCSDNNGINEFFDDMVDIERLAKKIFFSVIITLAVLAMLPMAYREYRGWKTMQDRARLIKDDSYDQLDAVYLVSRPWTAGFGLWCSRKFSSPSLRAVIRWTVAYATTIPALFILSLAAAGLLGCLCQYILLRSLEKEVPALENQVIGFTDKVIEALNNASVQWATGTNHVILDINNMINNDVLGWVNTTTTAVNNTLNTFVNEMTKELNATFGGTVLYDPVMDVLECLVLLKIQGIESGLTWVSDHAKIDMPLLANDTFSLGTLAKVSGSSSDILATGGNGTAADDIADAVDHVIDALMASVRQETILSACVLLIWVIIVLVGLSQAMCMLYRGGNVETHPNQGSSAHPPASHGEKFELQQIPTYDQAISSPRPGHNSGNKFNGQAYTLTPGPLPTFEVNSATSPIMHTGYSLPGAEKTGTIGQNVDNAVRRQTHIRASSHGDYDITSPLSPPTYQNPFLSAKEVRDPKQNPFADPAR